MAGCGMGPRPGSERGRLKRRAHLLDLEALDLVAGLVVVETVEADTALEAGAHFVRVVLETAQRADLALEERVLAAADAGGDAAVDLAFGDETAGHEAAGHGEYLADIRNAELD